MPDPAQDEEKPLMKMLKGVLAQVSGETPAVAKPTPEQIKKRLEQEQKVRDEALRREKEAREGQGGGISVDRKMKRADDIINDTPGATVKQ